jgi:hypothetical protein
MCLEVAEREPAGPAAAGWTEDLLSIFEETGGGLSAVAHDRSLELFCDRHEVIAHFVSLINDDPPRRRLLYLHGLGGNGKSLLLRFLAARCCVRLPPGEWERVRRLPEAELPAVLSGVAKAARVPVARFWCPAGGGDAAAGVFFGVVHAQAAAEPVPGYHAAV